MIGEKRDADSSFRRRLIVKSDNDAPVKTNTTTKLLESIKRQLHSIRSREALLKEGEKALREKEEALRDRDEALKVREEALRERDEAIISRNNAIRSSFVDPLTGCFNRSYFKTAIENLPLGDDSHKKVGFVFIDINNLKAFNDKFGHEVGDQIIKDTARFLCSHFRKNHDTVIRLGGDEFIIICHNFRDNPNFETNLNTKLENCLRLESPSSFAYGVAVYNMRIDDNLYSTKDRADKAMYENKQKYKKENPNSEIISRKRIMDIIPPKKITRNDV